LSGSEKPDPGEILGVLRQRTRASSPSTAGILRAVPDDRSAINGIARNADLVGYSLRLPSETATFAKYSNFFGTTNARQFKFTSIWPAKYSGVETSK